jgi:hypothetical protein
MLNKLVEQQVDTYTELLAIQKERTKNILAEASALEKLNQ